jgi:hypothetical protein
MPFTFMRLALMVQTDWPIHKAHCTRYHGGVVMSPRPALVSFGSSVITVVWSRPQNNRCSRLNLELAHKGLPVLVYSDYDPDRSQSVSDVVSFKYRRVNPFGTPRRSLCDLGLRHPRVSIILTG